MRIGEQGLGRHEKLVRQIFIGTIVSVLLVVAFLATSAKAESGGAAIRTVTFSDTTFSDSAISVSVSSTSVSLVPGTPSTIEVQISSQATGPFFVGVASEGKDISVGMILQGYPTALPSGLVAQFPNGTTTSNSREAEVPVVLTALAGTDSGTVQLELIVYQQQGPLNLPAAYSGTIVNFSANIEG